VPALIFDCDGVLADTERDGHRPAFNETFAEVGLPVHILDDVLKRLRRERARRIDAVGPLTCQPECARPAHGTDQQRHPRPDRPRRREHPAIREEASLEVDLAIVQEGAHRIMRSSRRGAT